MYHKHILSKFKEIRSVSTDTRTLQKGDLFFALSGDNFNGNKFARQAIDKGASLAIIDDPTYNIEGKTILVEDSLHALQELAKAYRRELDIPIIGITGSNGKTTTKELCREVLSTQYKCLATRGNLNNHIGVPLSILSITSDIEIGIIEMGANHIGEIKDLCKIAQPTHGVITNIGKAHLEGFGSLEGVIEGKTELYKWLEKNDGVVFYDETSSIIKDNVPTTLETIPYGAGLIVKNTFPHIDLYYDGYKFISGLTGRYNALNIACAIQVGFYFDVDRSSIYDAIKGYTSDINRSQIIYHGSNTIILDAYNANPISMRAAIEHIQELKGDKLLILGDMLELGNYSQQEHKDIVDLLYTLDNAKVLLVGKEFRRVNDSFNNYENVMDLLENEDLTKIKNTTILLKGSRGIALEKIVKSIV